MCEIRFVQPKLFMSLLVPQLNLHILELALQVENKAAKGSYLSTVLPAWGCALCLDVANGQSTFKNGHGNSHIADYLEERMTAAKGLSSSYCLSVAVVLQNFCHSEQKLLKSICLGR